MLPIPPFRGTFQQPLNQGVFLLYRLAQMNHPSPLSQVGVKKNLRDSLVAPLTQLPSFLRFHGCVMGKA